MDLAGMCKQVCELATETGKWIRHEAENIDNDKIEVKGVNNFVTYVDKTSEKKLVDGLRGILPEAGFITEEGTATDSGQWRWIIDPLDGTTNFIHKVPPYSISIGLADSNNEIILGVVYEIFSGECFYAWKDGGAYLNGRPIHVSSTDSINNALIATGFPYTAFHRMEGFLKSLSHFFVHSHGVRRLGSAAVDMAYVACGRFDVFYEYNLNPWDVAAGIILVKEAGGQLSDFKGGKNYLFGMEMIASNGKIHHNFVDTLKQFL
jgi:myo-inositol-1(or 4)-monophosphatase